MRLREQVDMFRRQAHSELKNKHHVSIACAERMLLPAACNAADDELVVVNRFSCREQILQTGGREPLHLAQILQMTLRDV